MPIDLKATTSIPAGIRHTLGLPVSAKLYGAVGDGVTDDTAELQAAIDAVTATGLVLFIPAGTYLISSALTVTAGEGWRIMGAGRQATTIKQATNNTPVFHFPNTGTSRWQITDLAVTWSSQQAIASTSAIGFAFGNAGALPDGWGHWDFRIAHVRFSNGVYGVTQTNTGAVNPLWGCEFDDLSFDETWVGPALRLINTGGSPDVTVRRVYVNAQGFDSAAPYVFAFTGHRGLLIDNLEVNTCGLAQELFIDTSTLVSVRSYRTEGGTISDPWNGIVTCATSDVTVDGIEVLTKEIDIGGGNYCYALRCSSGAASRVRAHGIYAQDITSTTGAIHGLNAAAGVIRYQDVTGFAETIFPYDASATRITGWDGRDVVFGRGPRVTSGSGTPEGAVTAAVGSIFLRDDGGAGTSLYVKESGAGNTGWVGSSDLADLTARWVPASSSAPASLDFLEDTDNGSNKATLTAPSSLTGDRTVTLPDATGTLITGTQADATYGPLPTNAVVYAVWTAPNAGTWTSTQTGMTTYLAGGFRFGPSTVNNEASWTVPLKAGTYTFGLVHTKENNRGIYDVKLDGTTIATIDGYDAGTGVQAFTETTSVTVPTDGLHTVRFLMASKNASSSAYYGSINVFTFSRTGA